MTNKPNGLPIMGEMSEGQRGSLDDYILQHIDQESEYMHRLWRAT